MATGRRVDRSQNSKRVPTIHRRGQVAGCSCINTLSAPKVMAKGSSKSERRGRQTVDVAPLLCEVTG
jgi:hypothetical protein